MRRLVFPLALLLIAACGSSSKHSDAKTGGSPTAAADGSLLVAVYEMHEQDGGALVGTVYKRDHGDGRMLFWVHDLRGTRRGYVTMNNRAYAYEYALGKRSDNAYFIGADTISASSRKVIGHNRAIRLEQIDLDTWARKGTHHEEGRDDGMDAEQPAGSEEDADGDE